jgi:hypothetical protein
MDLILPHAAASSLQYYVEEIEAAIDRAAAQTTQNSIVDTESAA